MGTSTRWDAIQTFGNPLREEANDYPNSDTWYVYKQGGPFPGQFTVVINKKSELVVGMFLDPTQLSAKQVIEHFGNNYVVTRYDFCPGSIEAESTPVYESATGSATYIEYRELGIAILINAEGLVNNIRYLQEPVGFKSLSECPRVEANDGAPQSRFR